MDEETVDVLVEHFLDEAGSGCICRRSFSTVSAPYRETLRAHAAHQLTELVQAGKILVKSEYY